MKSVSRQNNLAFFFENHGASIGMATSTSVEQIVGSK